jgi:hypothetical protein
MPAVSVFIGTLLILAGLSHSAVADTADQAINQQVMDHLGAAHWSRLANSKNLSTQRQWLALLHYDYKSPGRRQSYVDDARFFSSPEGQADPAAELQATLTAFFDDPQVQCRFVARRDFLTTALDGLQAALPPVECTKYEAWRVQVNASQAVLVLASSYLNSPSSMYGHTFLRFDPAGAETTLLSYVLNFGANFDEDDNGFMYAWRGIAGGYPGVFAANRYLDKIKEYSRLENRDLWEYRLNLSPPEVDRMLAHIWELDQINFDYYFFDENCSYRLLELIDVARPGLNLSDNFGVMAIPIDTVRVVEKAGLVDRVEYRPSNQTVIQFRINKLSPDNQSLAYALADDINVRDSEAFTALDREKQGETIDVAYKYLRYRNDDNARSDAIAKQSFELLSMLPDYDLPAAFIEAPPVPVRPDQGHRTMLASLSGGSEDGDAFSDLEWRLSYHDLLDGVAGYAPQMSLNMGRFVLRTRHGDGLQLQRLDVIEITSLSPRNRFFSPWSWQVQTGLDRQWTNGSDKLVPQLNGGAGLSYSAPLDGVAYGLLRSRLEYNQEFDRNLDIAGGALLGYLRQGARSNTLIELEQLWFTDGVDRTLIKIGQNLALTTNAALRLDFKRSINDSEGVSEVSLAYRYYF